MVRTGYFRTVTLVAGMLAAAVVAVLVGYGSASAQDGEPGVVNTNPRIAATNVDRDTNVKVKFTQKMMKSSINTQTVTLTPYVNPNTCGESCPGPVSAKVTYNAEKKLAILNPTNRLAANTEYIVYIYGGTDPAVKNQAGTPMSYDYTSYFTTGAS